MTRGIGYRPHVVRRLGIGHRDRSGSQPFILAETARNLRKGASAQVTDGLGMPFAMHFVTARISRGVRDCDSQF